MADQYDYEDELDMVYSALAESEPEFCRWLEREKVRRTYPPTYYENLPILLNPYSYEPDPLAGFEVVVTDGDVADAGADVAEAADGSYNSSGDTKMGDKGKAVMVVNEVDHPAGLPLGWRCKTKTRSSGQTKGRVDKVYISPGNRKYRSKVEAQKSLLDDTTRF